MKKELTLKQRIKRVLEAYTSDGSNVFCHLDKMDDNLDLNSSSYNLVIEAYEERLYVIQNLVKREKLLIETLKFYTDASNLTCANRDLKMMEGVPSYAWESKYGGKMIQSKDQQPFGTRAKKVLDKLRRH